MYSLNIKHIVVDIYLCLFFCFVSVSGIFETQKCIIFVSELINKMQTYIIACNCNHNRVANARKFISHISHLAIYLFLHIFYSFWLAAITKCERHGLKWKAHKRICIGITTKKKYLKYCVNFSTVAIKLKVQRYVKSKNICFIIVKIYCEKNFATK